MNRLISIKVECHAGHCADEYPLKFYLDNMVFRIAGIIDRWHQSESSPDYPMAAYFKVATADQHHYILKHALEEDRWFLLVKGEAIHLEI